MTYSKKKRKEHEERKELYPSKEELINIDEANTDTINTLYIADKLNIEHCKLLRSIKDSYYYMEHIEEIKKNSDGFVLKDHNAFEDIFFLYNSYEDKCYVDSVNRLRKYREFNYKGFYYLFIEDSSSFRVKGDRNIKREEMKNKFTNILNKISEVEKIVKLNEKLLQFHYDNDSYSNFRYKSSNINIIGDFKEEEEGYYKLLKDKLMTNEEVNNWLKLYGNKKAIEGIEIGEGQDYYKLYDKIYFPYKYK